jgi:2-polyprenyl-3-methyl-5-hydroxy-6-metoxy-1,4-benzoquinol methylase
MSVSSRLFARIQRADFYRGYMSEAIEALPPGRGRTLLDVGCGPGLMARLAARHGYQAHGIDADAAMITTARRLAGIEDSSATFAHLTVTDGRLPLADVVVAASLLVVVPDPAATLNELWLAVQPGGSLLVIEATRELTSDHARSHVAREGMGRDGWLLRLWAAARQGRSLDPAVLDGVVDSTEPRTRYVMDGMVRLWIVDKSNS